MKKLITIILAAIIFTSCSMAKKISHNINSNYAKKSGGHEKSQVLPANQVVIK